MALQDWLHWIGLARKAGKLAPGDRQVREAMRDESAKVVIIAEDAGQAVYRKYHLWAQDLGIPVIQQASKRDLGHAMGMGPHAVLAVQDEKIAQAILAKVTDNAGGIDFARKGQGESLRISQGVEDRQSSTDRSTSSSKRGSHKESHEHSGTRGRANGPQHHGGEVTGDRRQATKPTSAPSAKGPRDTSRGARTRTASGRPKRDR